MSKKQFPRPKLRVVYEHAEIKGWLTVNGEEVPLVSPLEEWDSHLEFDRAMSDSKMKVYVRPTFPSDAPVFDPKNVSFVLVKEIRKGLSQKDGVILSPNFDQGDDRGMGITLHKKPRRR